MKKKIIVFYLFIALFVFAALDGLLVYNNSNSNSQYKAEEVTQIVNTINQDSLIGGFTTQTINVNWTAPTHVSIMKFAVNGDISSQSSGINPPTFDLIDSSLPGYLVSNVFNLGGYSISQLDVTDNSLPKPDQKLQYKTAASESALATTSWIDVLPSACTDQFFQYRVKFNSGVTNHDVDYSLTFTANRYYIDATVKDTSNNPIDNVTFDLGTNSTWTTSHSSPGVYRIQVLKPSNYTEVGILALKDGYDPYYGSFTVNTCANDQNMTLDIVLAQTPVVTESPSPSPSPSESATTSPSPSVTPSTTTTATNYSSSTSSVTGSSAKKSTTPPATFYRNQVAVTTPEAPATPASTPKVPEITSLNNATAEILNKCITSDCSSTDLPQFKEGSYLTFTGTAEPNSIVKLYIYSDPIIAEAVTDQEGNWTYILTQKLAPGDHYAEAEAINGQGLSSGKQKLAKFNVISSNSASTKSTNNWLLIGGISALIIIVLVAIIYILFKPKKQPEIIA